MSIPDEIKARVDARQCLEFYGVPVDRRGFAKCPFHQGDKNGSLKVYDGDKGFHCFACGKGSSVVDFVMLYFGLPFQAAQEKLNADFNLGLPIGKALSPTERANAVKEARQRKEAAQERERKLQSLKDAADRALTAFVLADKIAGRVKTGQALAQRDAAWYNLCEAEKNLADFENSR